MFDSLLIRKFYSLTNKLKSICRPEDIAVANKEANEFIANPKFDGVEIKEKFLNMVSSNTELKNELNKKSISILNICDILLREQIKFDRNHFLACFLVRLFCVARFFNFMIFRKFDNNDVKVLVDECLYEPWKFFFKQILVSIVNSIMIILFCYGSSYVITRVVDFSDVAEDLGVDVDDEFLRKLSLIIGNNAHEIFSEIYGFCITVIIVIRYNIISREIKNEQNKQNKL